MASQKKIYLLVIFVILIIVACLGIFLTLNLKKNSGLQIDTFPKAKVFLNNKEVGMTPFYQEGLPPGESRLKLIAEAPGLENNTYETTVKLTSGALTMISRVFDNSLDYSSGQVDYLSAGSLGNTASVTIISDPDGSLVKIDGEDKGLTPLNIKNLRIGGHEIVVVKPGYNSQPVNGQLKNGYELNIFVKLSKIRDQNLVATSSAIVLSPPPVASKSAATGEKTVVIKETGTGFLRVRSDPTLEAKEIGRVTPGDTVPYLEINSEWVKIKFGTGSGWINKAFTSL